MTRIEALTVVGIEFVATGWVVDSSTALEVPRSPDSDLIARFISRRDEAAFAELVRRHGPLVSAVCHRLLSDVGNAEDAAQATFLVLARRASSIRKSDSLGSWLYGVAVRVSVKMRSKLKKTPLGQLHDEFYAKRAPAFDPGWRETREILDVELALLPERYRAPLVECYLNGKSRDEAAVALGVPLNILRGRLERGREKLKRSLVRRGVTLSLAGTATLLAELASPAEQGHALAAEIAENAVHYACTSGPVSGAVFEIADSMLKELMMSKLKIAALSIMFTGGLFCAIALAWEMREPIEGATPDQQQILGVWTITEVQNFAPEQSAEERQALADGKYKIEITSNHFVFPNQSKGKYKLDPTKRPKQLRVEPERTSVELEEFFDLMTGGKSVPSQVGHAIYELSGDTLRICWGWSGKAPTSFDVKKQPSALSPSLWILRREPSKVQE